MLLPILPSSVIFPTIRPVESTDPVFFVVDVLSLVLAAIGPLGLSVAVHLVVLPFAFVFAVFAPHVDP